MTETASVIRMANLGRYLVALATKKGKGSPYSITERRVPELITVLGSQLAGDVSHKPGGRLPLLSARPAVIPQPLRGLLPILLLDSLSLHTRWSAIRHTRDIGRVSPSCSGACVRRLASRLSATFLPAANNSAAQIAFVLPRARLWTHTHRHTHALARGR